MPLFGVTFYPDLWPKQYWDVAFSEIKNSGLDLVRFGEMSWNWIEKGEGRFDFREMDEAIALAKEHNLKILLGLSTSQAPQWLIHKYSEIRPVANDGSKPPEYGPRPNVCRDSKIYKKYVERYIRKMAQHYHKHPALFAWQLDNEPSYPPLDSTTSKDYCHCKETENAFREWAKNKYNSIEELNKCWGTTFWTCEFTSFEEISTPKAGMWDAGNPHIYLDWFRFKSERLRDWLTFEKNLVKKYDKTHKVGTNSFTTIPTRIGDHDVLASSMEWFGWDIYPKGTMNNPPSLAQIADYWRSLCSDRGIEFHVTELQGGPNVRWGYKGNVEGPEIRLWTHQIAAHGAEVILYHGFRPPLFGSETGGFGIVKADGSATKRLESIKIAVSELKKVSDILKTHRLMPEVAIGYLKSSEIEAYQEIGPERGIPKHWTEARGDLGLMYGLDSIAGAHRIIWNYYNPTAFAFERHFENGTLPYKIIILTNPYLLKEKYAKVLKKYIYDGGILITEARFGLKNEYAHLYEKPLLENFFDVAYDYTEIIDDKINIPTLSANAYGFRDIVDAKEGVLATFSDGKPAIIEKKLGRGKALYATFSLFISCLKWENAKLIEFLRSFLPEPEIKLQGPPDVEVVVWEDTSPILYVINHGRENAEITLKIPEKFTSIEDLLKGEDLEVKFGRIDLSCLPQDVRLLHLKGR